MFFNLKDMPIYSPRLGIPSSRLLDQEVFPICPYYCEKRKIQKQAELTPATEKQAA